MFSDGNVTATIAKPHIFEAENRGHVREKNDQKGQPYLISLFITGSKS